MKYGELNLGQVEAIVNKLGGMEGAKRFLAGELVVQEQTKPTPELKIFKTLTLGQHGSPKAYRKALESAGFRIGDYAGQILKKISVAKTPTQVDLVRVTVAELGFKDGARRDAIYTRAIELGLQLCPAEVGPALRLVYQEDPWVVVGMEPITDSDGLLVVFSVDTDGDDRWLGSLFGDPDVFWFGDDRWVFVRPRK